MAHSHTNSQQTKATKFIRIQFHMLFQNDSNQRINCKYLHCFKMKIMKKVHTLQMAMDRGYFQLNQNKYKLKVQSTKKAPKKRQKGCVGV